MTVCKTCGAEIKESSRFCKICGVKVENEQDITPQDSQYKAAPKPQKPEKTFVDKKAITSIILSSLGLLCFINVPAQLLGLIFGIGGLSSKRFKPLSIIGIIFSIVSLVISSYTAFFIFTNFDNILNTNFFNAFYDSYKGLLG